MPAKKKKRGKEGVSQGSWWEEEREGGTGRHCVSGSPFYSFTLVPFWPLGGDGN